MADREKVINGLECCFNVQSGWKDAVWVCPACPYAKNDGKPCETLAPLLDEALALLKAQEPIEARLHLCESCAKEYPECGATVDGIEFGGGVGNDNIIGCTAYVNRWKAQQPRVMTLAEIWERGDSEPLYLEYLIQNRIELRPAVFQPDNSESKGHMCMASAWRASGFYNKEGYGITWRCWTSRPTDEQREATPWDVGTVTG